MYDVYLSPHEQLVLLALFPSAGEHVWPGGRGHQPVVLLQAGVGGEGALALLARLGVRHPEQIELRQGCARVFYYQSSWAGQNFVNKMGLQ